MGDVIATSVSSLIVYAGGMFSTSNSTQQTFLSSINGVAFANIGSGGGIAGIPSSLNTSSISTFSLIGTTGFISSLTVNGLFIGSNQGFVNMGDVIATSISSLVVYTGSAFATSNQASITSTQQLNISSINGQTFGGPITSTLIGLGTAGYVSTSQLLSTSLGINLFISTIFVDHPELQSTVAGLGTVGYISSIGGFRLISTANLANLVSTANLANLVSTANLANLVSTANLARLISTPNLANFVSTTFLSTQLGSTFAVLNVSSFSTFSFTGTTGFMSTLRIGTTNTSYMLDVNGIARSGIPVSSLTGTSATFGATAFGIYYYITNSGFSNIGLFNTLGGATGSGGTAPPMGTGWYVTLRNNTGSYLSITVNGLLASTPASPFVIPPANAVSIAYDANLAGGSGYVFF
jgi:hypothetical protein